MDKAEIRAKAEILRLALPAKPKVHEQFQVLIEAALTAAYDQGWDDGVEAAVKVEPQYDGYWNTALYQLGVKHKEEAIRRLSKKVVVEA